MASGSLFRHRDFRLLWVGQTISELGSNVTTTAVPLLAALVLAATPFQMGLLAAAPTTAFLLIGLPAGVWVDRMRRRSLMLGADLGRAALLLSVPVAWWAGVLTIAQLIVVGLLVGVLTVFFDVAYQSYLPSLISREHLVDGNGKLQASLTTAQVTGPALGGGLTQWVGAANAVLVDALSYLASALCLWRIRTPEPEPERPETRPRLRADIAEGLRFVFGNRMLTAIVITTGVSNFFTNVIGAVDVLLLTRQLGASAGIVGLLLTTGSVGGVLGALASGRLIARFGQARTIWASLVATSPFMLLIPLVGRGPLLLLFAAGNLVSWAGAVVYNVAQVSFRQSICPDRLLGRMNASVRFLVWGTIPLGGLLGGVLGSTIGLREAMWVGAVGAMLAPVSVLLSPLRGLRDLPESAQPAPAPANSDPGIS
ncbi:MAG TPA: MFS transporter [Pseudonocardiaceae bacterium]|jgi:MFS family permease|nr:MFS transporter [Pseudonocardiaceae bacterium]